MIIDQCFTINTTGPWITLQLGLLSFTDKGAIAAWAEVTQGGMAEGCQKESPSECGGKPWPQL